MKVAFFLPHGTKGGAEQLILQVAKEHHRRNSSITFFFLTNKNIDRFRNEFPGGEVRFIICPVKRELFGFLLAPFYCLFFLRRTRFDLLMSSHVHMNGLVGLLKGFNFLSAKKHIGRESTQVFRRYSKKELKVLIPFYRFGYKYIDTIICQTELMRTDLLSNVPWLNVNTQVVTLPNPINLKEARLLKEQHISLPDFKYIVAAGSLFPVKGFDILINAFKIVKNSQPELKLIILGTGYQEHSLLKLIEEFHLSGEAMLLGWKENVYPYFKNAEACVISSRIEGFPNVLLQQMACNTTIVSTKCSDGIEKTPGIFTCETNDKDALALVIIEALASDTSLNREIFDQHLDGITIEKYVDELDRL